MLYPIFIRSAIEWKLYTVLGGNIELQLTSSLDDSTSLFKMLKISMVIEEMKKEKWKNPTTILLKFSSIDFLPKDNLSNDY